MEFIVYAIAAWSCVDILVNGKIFDGFRNHLLVESPWYSWLTPIFTCVQCSGFWIGFMLGVLSALGFLPSPITYLTMDDSVASIHVFGNAFFVSGCSVILNGLLYSLFKK